MAPATRAIYRPRTPPTTTGPGEANTVKKTKFFDAWDARPKGESQRAFCNRTKYLRTTTQRWLDQRDQLGDIAYRHTRQLSNRLGRPSRVQKKHVKKLLDPKINSVRHEPLEVQIAEFDLRISVRQLRRRFAALTNKAQMYKAAYYKDELAESTERVRVEYGWEHQNHTVSNYWQWVYFTDEFHYDPTSQRAPRLLREAGTRYDLDNVIERPPKQGVVLHAAG